jgi:hypothetical protein
MHVEEVQFSLQEQTLEIKQQSIKFKFSPQEWPLKTQHVWKEFNFCLLLRN